jgi:hypothetical protein
MLAPGARNIAHLSAAFEQGVIADSGMPPRDPVDATAAIAARLAVSCRFDDCETQTASSKLKAPVQ